VPTFVSALLMTTFFFVTMAVALPIIDKLGSARLPRRRRPASVRGQSALAATGPAFTPLEMADSGQKWPSEVPNRRTPLVMPTWPSETWKDNPFPASRAIARQLVKTPPRSSGTTPSTTKPPATAQLKKVRAQPKARPQTKRSRPQPKAQRKPLEQAPRSRPSTSPDSPPKSENILEIANDPSRGLASAVEVVRQTTGWSFQRAAQHVATVLRNNS
jgi:hypothetical protein